MVYGPGAFGGGLVDGGTFFTQSVSFQTPFNPGYPRSGGPGAASSTAPSTLTSFPVGSRIFTTWNGLMPRFRRRGLEPFASNRVQDHGLTVVASALVCGPEAHREL